MPLQLQDVQQTLAAHQLRNPVLPFLNKNPALVRVLMFQPDGTVVASPQAVHVQDRARMTAQMEAFLQKAIDANVDLATCPEYSCTWDALLSILNKGLFPEAGKLWALACESATPIELTAVIQQLPAGTVVVLDHAVLTMPGDFIDPLCFLFRTHSDTSGAEVRVALIQPKTQPMGGHPFELQHLKTGNHIFRFKNSGAAPSNSLVGLICSDALHPEFPPLIPSLQTDVLLLHLQLNPNPSSAAFRGYRSPCCLYEPRTAEILCLNWARGTSLLENGQLTPLISEPKTILFREAEKVFAEDAHIEENHAKGCYLTNWQTHRTAAFVFSPDPHLFYFETTKPSTAGAAVIAIRTGPRMRELLSWTGDAWQLTPADDRFRTHWFDAHPALQPLLGPLLSRYLYVERLVQLCVGYAATMDWTNWKRLQSFELADDDTAQRLTLCWSNTGIGQTFREHCLSLFRGFMAVVGSPAQFSNRLVAFKTAAFRVEHRAQPLFNGFRNLFLDNGNSATGIYLGQTPSGVRLRKVRKQTMEGLFQTQSDTQLLAIWYRDEMGLLHDFMDDDPPQINADPKESPVAIVNTQL